MWHSCYKCHICITLEILVLTILLPSSVCQPRPCLTFMKWDTECTDSRSCCSFSQWAAVGMEVASRHSPHLTTQHISYYRYYRHCVFSVLSNSPQLPKFLTPADTSKSEKNVVVLVDRWFVIRVVGWDFVCRFWSQVSHLTCSHCDEHSFRGDCWLYFQRILNK